VWLPQGEAEVDAEGAKYQGLVGSFANAFDRAALGYRWIGFSEDDANRPKAQGVP
jgi:hypothetical protein